VSCSPSFLFTRWALLSLIAIPAWASFPTSTSCSATPLQFYGGPVNFTATVSANGVGIPSGTVSFTDGGFEIASASLNESGTGQATIKDLTIGFHVVTCSYSGDSRFDASASQVTLSIAQGVPSITLSASRNPSPTGQPVSIDITLKAALGSPSGNVVLIDGITVLAWLQLTPADNGSIATFTSSTLAPGTHTLTARYEGDPFFFPLPVSLPLTLVIGKQPASISITGVSPNPSKSGQLIAIQVQVQATGASGSPTGSVSVVEGTVTLGAGILTNGQATMTLSGLSPGPHNIVAKYAGDPTFDASASAPFTLNVQPGSLTVVLAGSLDKTVAPDSIVAVFGDSFVSSVVTAAVLPLPASLGGLTLIFRDGSGDHAAGLAYVSPGQINAVVPSGLAPGTVTVILRNANGDLATGTATIAVVAPGLFTVDGSPTGIAAATVETLHADGSLTTQDVFQCTGNKCVAVPIDLGSDGDQVVLTLFGTGIRHVDKVLATPFFQASVTARIAGQDLTPSYAGPQPQFPGLDQVNVTLPPSLRGTGSTSVSIVIAGQSSNAVKIQLQ
jgi:uncharacterized protein (TIGR03437 family)